MLRPIVAAVLLGLAGCSNSTSPSSTADAPAAAGPDAPLSGAADAPVAVTPDAHAPAPDAPAPHADAAPPTPDAPPPADAPPPPDAPPPAITVTKDPESTGQGTVTSPIAGLGCDVACSSASATVGLGAEVDLEAKPVPGSYFQGWTGGCAGQGRFCTFTVFGASTSTARFGTIDHNLAFATSAAYATGDLGGIGGADAKCAAAASAAGLTGTFVAFLSTSTVDAVDRLGSARGWVRMDGLPIFDTVADIGDRVLWYPVKYDENTSDLLVSDQGSKVWTGSDPGGRIEQYGDTCSDWTSADGQGSFGLSFGGPLSWLFANPSPCRDVSSNYQGPYHIYCMMTDETTPLAAPTPTPGKKIWVTKLSFDPGGGIAAANALCASEKPSSVATAVALLATTTQAAADLLDMEATYVRPDGVALGTGADSRHRQRDQRLPTAHRPLPGRRRDLYRRPSRRRLERRRRAVRHDGQGNGRVDVQRLD